MAQYCKVAGTAKQTEAALIGSLRIWKANSQKTDLLTESIGPLCATTSCKYRFIGWAINVKEQPGV